MGVMGYRARTGFLAGLTVAQISEFSLIFAAMGVALGHLTDSHMALVTLVGITTIVGSTLMILHSGALYGWLGPLLRPFERRVPKRELSEESVVPAAIPDVVLIGLGRFGGEIAQHLRQADLGVLGLDFDPFVVHEWNRAGHRAEYADADDPDLAERLPLSRVKWIICTVPDLPLARGLLQTLAAAGYQGRTAFTVHHAADGNELKRSGASLVLFPFADAACQAAEEVIARLEATR